VLTTPAVQVALARAYRRGQEAMRGAAEDAARIIAVAAGDEHGAVAAARAEAALAVEAAIRRLPIRPYDADEV
jgi:Ni,Fe-hydrogenase I small subunit